MSLLVGVIYAWIVVYAILGVYFSLLGGRRRVSAYFLVFGLLCMMQAFYAWSTTRQYAAIDPRVGLHWSVLRTATGVLIAGLMINFSLRVRESTGWARKLAHPCGIAALVLPSWLTLPYVWRHGAMSVRTIRFLDQTFETMAPAWDPYLALSLAPVALAGCFTMGALLVTAVRSAGWLRAVALATGLSVAVAAYDLTVWAWHLPWVFLSEHGFFVFDIVVSYVLTTRIAEELTIRVAELKRVRSKLRSVREALERKEQLAAVGELSAVVAHEIRNPLGAMANAVAALRHRDVRDQDRDLLLEILDEETSRLNRIVGDLLQLARPITAQLRMVDLTELCDRAVSKARLSSLEVRIDFADDARAPFGADGHLLRQALDNLVDNALQAMGSDGVLTLNVRARVRDGRAGREIAVGDTGEGMNTEVRQRARDPFFTTRSTGTGLGLAIVDRIVRAHDGRLDIESARFQGTTVRVWMPERAATEISGENAVAPEGGASRAGA